MNAPDSAVRFETDLVRRYYERHTQTFVAFGQGAAAGVLHRAVWAPGVTTRAAAFHYVHERIAGVAAPLATENTPLRFIDLGCGVGGSLAYLAQRMPMTGVGITLSPTQAGLARSRLHSMGLSDRVTIMAGDFSRIPESVASADVAYAIESFVHATNPARLLSECGRLVRSGGALVICDDFRRPVSNAAAVDAVDRFCRGWHINTLLDRDGLRALAEGAGFAHEETTDLSRWVEVGRPRDRVIDWLTSPFARLGWHSGRLGPWLGGTALQTCLRNGWVGYDLVVFRRV